MVLCLAAAASRRALRHLRRRPVAPPYPSASIHSAAAIYVPLPKLAPHMTSGKVKWLKAEGEAFACYDLLAEISSSTLVEEAHRVGQFLGEVTLVLEAQEDGVLAKVFKADPDESLPVGTPIAALCEEQDEVEEVVQAAAAAVSTGLPQDLYAPEAQAQWRVWGGWQAYLKAPKGSSTCTSGCG